MPKGSSQARVWFIPRFVIFALTFSHHPRGDFFLTRADIRRLRSIQMERHYPAVGAANVLFMWRGESPVIGAAQSINLLLTETYITRHILFRCNIRNTYTPSIRYIIMCARRFITFFSLPSQHPSVIKFFSWSLLIIVLYDTISREREEETREENYDAREKFLNRIYSAHLIFQHFLIADTARALMDSSSFLSVSSR